MWQEAAEGYRVAEARRRLAAILFSDIAGYTSQMGADEERAIAAVERSRRVQRGLVDQFRGEWLQEIGDGVLAIFPSTVDAVSCALEIQGQLRDDPDIEVRIGVHEGDLVFQGKDVFGDGLNVASRLQEAAVPGGLCVSGRVYDELLNKRGIQASFLGEREFKNVNRAIRVYALSAEEGTPERDERGAAPDERAGGGWLRPRRRRATLAIALLVLCGLGYGTWRSRDAVLAALIVSYPRVFGPAYEQEIGFTRAPDGVRIAYATSGSGPPIVYVIGWFTHLEQGAGSPSFPLFAPMFHDEFTWVRYDGRGMGLSDRGVEDFSLDARVSDLEAVVDALGLDRFAMLAHSAGGPTAVTYAARHPERVTRIAFYGSFARIAVAPERIELLGSLIPLARVGWGQDNPAFRELFTSLFMANRDAVTRRLFTEFQRRAAHPEDAAHFFETLIDEDVRELAARISLPVLVIHSTGDKVVLLEQGRELASLIPGARLLTLDGDDHVLEPTSAAAKRRDEALKAFFAEDLKAPATPLARLGGE
jgi:class 3 adenylate cyclase/pimeloyl-ACP methyl ester carboxylesterase